MFETLGKVVSRWWPLLLVGWVAALIGLKLVAPSFRDIAQNGEFAFLPKDSPSLIGEELYRQAWGKTVASNIVIVLRRESSPSGLLESDKEFIEKTLRPKLEEIASQASKWLKPNGPPKPPSESGADADAESETISVRTYTDKSMGRLLESETGQASLVLIELPTEFLNRQNEEFIAEVEALVGRNGKLQSSGVIPRGLDLALSGSAIVGRDMLRAANESSRDTEKWTVILVLLMLVVIYRTPRMALIPLITVGVATEISLALLACLGKWQIVSLFSGIQVYVKVLSYGAGVDYCLFLIARFKEELNEGTHQVAAVSNSLAKVGHALVASAGTVICGIGMMVFAEFGKFQQAGVGISLGLVIVLLASLTFSPSLLLLGQQLSFRRKSASGSLTRTSGWIPSASLWSRIFAPNLGQLIWTYVSELVRRHPGRVLASSVVVMIPFAWVGVHFRGHLSYGLLSELPRDTTSVVGAEAVAQHFAPGISGPITFLVQSKGESFLNEETGQVSDNARLIVEALTEELKRKQDQFALADVRSIVHPFGGGLSDGQKPGPIRQVSAMTEDKPRGSPLIKGIEERLKAKRILQHYISPHGELAGKVLRLDLILREDPFARNSIGQFELIQKSLMDLLPPGCSAFAIGPTASIRDLKNVTDRDQIRIDVLVLSGVFLILIAMIRKFTISLYLIISVFFSYLVTLGVTFAVFWAMAPSDFAGLDWKVPMFLFTILIAVGEDYNIFLMTRIEEEQAIHGEINGVIVALQRTGSIISSCGVIMAGTFCSLMAGSLVGMQQLGFALAFGVLLDTFVVRPILVPAFLVLLHAGRLTSWKRLMTPTGSTLSPAVDSGHRSDVGGE
jgi:RND superfamily putative drug exporter